MKFQKSSMQGSKVYAMNIFEIASLQGLNAETLKGP